MYIMKYSGPSDMVAILYNYQHEINMDTYPQEIKPGILSKILSLLLLELLDAKSEQIFIIPSKMLFQLIKKN